MSKSIYKGYTMTRLEFVRKHFEKNITAALATVGVDGKGRYTQYIDSWDHFISIDFQVKGNVVVADIKGVRDEENPFTRVDYDFKGYAEIADTLRDAIVELVAYAQRVTGYTNPEINKGE